MKLDDKIQIKRVAYLLKGEQSTAFELALLYYILATRRIAEDKIADACLKSIQWLKKAEIGISDDIYQLDPAEQIKSLERTLVNNKAMICRPASPRGEQADLPDRQALVHVIPMFYRDFGLVPQLQ